MQSDLAAALPEDLVKNTLALCGERGRMWLSQLPELIARLEQKWKIKAHPWFEGIEYNYVAPATAANGSDVVLKLGLPQTNIEIFGEAKYLRTLDGRHTVRILREDRESLAILMERAMPGTGLIHVFRERPGDSVRPAADLLKSIAMPVPQDRSDTVALDAWFEKMGRSKGTAFEPYGLKALEMYNRLSASTAHVGYRHGDYHPGNIVLSGESFVVIDAKGVIGHIGYDIGVFLLNFYRWQMKDPELLRLLESAVNVFSSVFDIPPAEIKEWAFAQSVLSAWWTFDETPELYKNDVAHADIWDV